MVDYFVSFYVGIYPQGNGGKQIGLISFDDGLWIKARKQSQVPSKTKEEETHYCKMQASG